VNPLTVNPAIVVQHVQEAAHRRDAHRPTRRIPAQQRTARPDRAIQAARTARAALLDAAG
jgi:hypothetical protein